MFNVKENRLDYRTLLSPPDGYEITFAVGTTYSLDLETLTAVCAIIDGGIEADSELQKNPVALLAALAQAKDKLLIFSQAGQIQKPDKLNELFPLLDHCVYEVKPKKGFSFHPKVWFIKYSAKGTKKNETNKKGAKKIEAEKPDRFRLIVLSRNLTFDRSWDVAVSLDSIANETDKVFPTGEQTGAAMKDFLEWLSKKFDRVTPANNRQRLETLAKEFSKAKWQSPGKEFDRFDFIPYGIGKDKDYPTNLFDKFEDLFIISPFLSKSTIEKFAAHRPKNQCTLITRESELHKLNADLLTTFETWVLKDDVVDGEDQLGEQKPKESGNESDDQVSEVPDDEREVPDDELGTPKKQDIHAKVYLRTNDSERILYLGSANASFNAFNDNIECLLALWGKKGLKKELLEVELLKKDLFGFGDKYDEKKNPFRLVEPEECVTKEENEEEKIQEKLKAAIKAFCDLEPSPTACVTGKQEYTITVTMNVLPEPNTDVKLYLSPLMKETDKQPIAKTVKFTGLKLSELSHFYVLTAESKGGEPLSRVIRINTGGIPEKRDSAIYSTILDNKERLYDLIRIFLADDSTKLLAEGLQAGISEKEKGNRTTQKFIKPSFYEDLLKAVVKSPEKIIELKKMIGQLESVDQKGEWKEELKGIKKFFDHFDNISVK